MTPITIGVEVPVSGDVGSLQNYSFNIPEGTLSFVVTLAGGTGDADLYLKVGEVPATTADHDLSSAETGTNELLEVFAPPIGAYTLLVEGYEAFDGATLLLTTDPMPAVAEPHEDVTIVFAPLTDTPMVAGDVTGDGLTALPALQVFAYQLAGNTVVLALPALQVAATSAALEAPQGGDVIMTLPALQVVASGGGSNWGTASLTLPALEAQGYEVAGNHSVVVLPALDMHGQQALTIPTGYATLTPRPAMALLGSDVWVATDGIALSGTAATPRHIANLIEGTVLVAAATSRGDFFLSATEAVTLSEQADVVFRIIAVEQFTLADLALLGRRQIIAAVEYLEVAALATSRATAIEAVIDAITVHELATRGWRIEQTESSEYADALVQTRRTVQALVESVALEALAEHSLRLTLYFDEGVVLDAQASSTAHCFEQLVEAVDFTAAFRIGGVEYVAWVLNAESEAVSRYSNFGFNSFAEYDGRQFGAMDNRLCELTGDDDDGAAINAVVRGGLGNFGTSLLKHMAMAYVMLTTDGQLVLKLHATVDGRREVHWYALEGRTGDSLHEDRVKPDGGLASVQWGWELINLDGADFSVDQMSFVPMITSRRV